jgi:hypothetical protein
MKSCWRMLSPATAFNESSSPERLGLARSLANFSQADWAAANDKPFRKESRFALQSELLLGKLARRFQSLYRFPPIFVCFQELGTSAFRSKLT